MTDPDLAVDVRRVGVARLIAEVAVLSGALRLCCESWLVRVGEGCWLARDRRGAMGWCMRWTCAVLRTRGHGTELRRCCSRCHVLLGKRRDGKYQQCCQSQLDRFSCLPPDGCRAVTNILSLRRAIILIP